MNTITRQVHIGFFKNEELALLTPHARLLFIGLWLLADNDGVVKYSYNRIKAELFPYEDVDITQGLNNLASSKFVTLNDDNTITVSNFKNYQDEKVRKFVKPSLNQIRDFASPLGFTEKDILVFWNWHESVDWYRGKTRITNWKNAIHTWAKKGNIKPIKTVEPKFDLGDEAKYYYDADLILSRVKRGFYPDFLKTKFESLPAKHRALVLSKCIPEQRSELLGE